MRYPKEVIQYVLWHCHQCKTCVEPSLMNKRSDFPKVVANKLREDLKPNEFTVGNDYDKWAFHVFSRHFKKDEFKDYWFLLNTTSQPMPIIVGLNAGTPSDAPIASTSAPVAEPDQHMIPFNAPIVAPEDTAHSLGSHSQRQSFGGDCGLDLSDNSDQNTVLYTVIDGNSHQHTVTDLSSLFEPDIDMCSSALFPSKQRTLMRQLVVETSVFDRALPINYRSLNTLKTIKLMPSLSANCFDTTERNDDGIDNVPTGVTIASHHSMRTIARTDTFGAGNSVLNMTANQKIIREFSSINQLRQRVDTCLAQSLLSMSIIVSNSQQILTAKQKVLLLSKPNEEILFDDFDRKLNTQLLSTCVKIAEGSSGEVFAAKDTSGKRIVFKVIALNGNEDDDTDESYAQVLPELVVSTELNRMKRGINGNKTPNFVEMLSITTTRGSYPKTLCTAWKRYHSKNRSHNEDPTEYSDDKRYVVLQLSPGGEGLNTRRFKSALETLSIFGQLALTLAAAETAYEFEHRDMHWGNVLVSATKQTRLDYSVNGRLYSLPSHGVFATIIDYTFSRISTDGLVFFDDWTQVNDIFDDRGENQYWVYRRMRANNNNDWLSFKAETNLFWLQYLLFQMKDKSYGRNTPETHGAAQRELDEMFGDLYLYASATEYVMSPDFQRLIGLL